MQHSFVADLRGGHQTAARGVSDVAASSVETLRQLTAPQPDDPSWFSVGRRSAGAFAERKDWLSRRVETIEFSGRCTVVRNISVDFEIPKKLPGLRGRAAKGTALVPISVFQKWPPLMGFNLVDPEGHPVSLYLRATNNQLDFGLLLGTADRALALGEPKAYTYALELRRDLARRLRRPEPERLSGDLRRELAAIVAGPRPSQAAVADAANGLKKELESHLEDAIARASPEHMTEIVTRITAAVDLAAQLAASSILWAPVLGSPGTDRIVKFSYLDAHDASRLQLSSEAHSDDSGEIENGWRRVEAALKQLLIACSWRKRTLFIALPHAGRYTRFHLDIRSPQGGVELCEAMAGAFPAASDGEMRSDAEVRSVPNLARDYPRLDVPDEYVGPESSRYYLDYGAPVVLADTSAKSGRYNSSYSDAGASAQIVDRRAHVYLGARSSPSHRVFLQVKMAATRRGFILGCFIAAAIIAILMTVAYYSLRSAAGHLEPTVVLLSAVPVVLGYVLVRPGEQDLERRHIAGVRAMAMVSGAMPILGALTLVLTHTGKAATPPPDLTVARPIWRALLIVSWATVAGLFISLLRAAPANDRRKARAGFRSR